MTEVLIGYDAYQSLTGLLGRANEALQSGEDPGNHLEELKELLLETRLNTVLAIGEILYAGGKRYQFIGSDGNEFACSIGQEGVIYNGS